ncbi:LptA/OstA family protein [Calothrix sp. 336/3]|uniref:LptA/OstA family protein n=1 Tax=Calothrix sp. 336/3 TaxID=1337936 RepID=UPI0004E39F7A|nr:LptA/OstA family protein [Calothrix sp. 336/3]AKG21992.1 OstA family protein [Calothrix sp. 336/3]
MKSFYHLKSLQKLPWGMGWMLPMAIFAAIATPTQLQPATAQNAAPNRPLTIRSDVQEYDAKTQVVTARGNVQLSYPSRQIQATAAQAQYFSKERRIILSGDVYILQQGGNSIRGERVTYLIDEGRFVALPRSNRQVESIYIVNDSSTNTSITSPAPKTPNLKNR